MAADHRIKVILHGASGRMGREVLSALCLENDIRLVGAVSRSADKEHLPLPNGSAAIPLASSLQALLTRCKADVVVDFSNAEAILELARVSAENGINLVIGTSGISPEAAKKIEELCISHEVGAVIAPNFAIGAILMIHMAQLAARYFDQAEIVEMHHAAKADAPSGTAIATARAMAASRGNPFVRTVPKLEPVKGSRDSQVEGVTIHAMRLPGLLAHQEVVFGTLGQTLTIRHDTISRECYIPGVMLAIREVIKRKGLTYGLDKLLNL